jgi:hypothetical protein
MRFENYQVYDCAQTLTHFKSESVTHLLKLGDCTDETFLCIIIYMQGVLLLW